MDYKEKYEMALEGIQEILGSGEDSIKMSRLQLRLQGIFPELRESEDEKIRKELISFFTERAKYTEDSTFNGLSSKDILAWLEKQGEQKPVDTAKQEMSDEEYCSLCMDINCDGCPYVDKSKHKEQKPVEWSEEDEEMYARIVRSYTSYEGRILYATGLSEDNRNNILEDLNEQELWLKYRLKSLRPQNTWKPSDEQMNALNYVVNLMASSERPTENDLYYNILKSLRQQLKKHYL